MTTDRSLADFRRLPDPPEREPDDLTAFHHLTLTGCFHHLIRHLGNPDTTLVGGGRRTALFTPGLYGFLYPDLLIAFDADPAAYRRSNEYLISEQSKPPDFVLEVAPRHRAGWAEVTDNRNDYVVLGVAEYWRFNEMGTINEMRLAGDRLEEDGRYQPIPVEEVADGILQGYSRVLNLLLRWENGQLRWHDPETGRRIVTFDDEREARIQAQNEARHEREALIREREARLLAEARARELEERLENLGNQ